MASGNLLATLWPEAHRPPATLYPALDVRVGGSTPTESNVVLWYDDTTVEYDDWPVFLPPHYGGGGLTLTVEWLTASATTGDVMWSAGVRRNADDADDLDTSHTYDYNNAAADTCASASGETSKKAITFTSGADMDSWVAGETATIRIRRFASDGGDTMTGDAGLYCAVLTET